MLVVRVSGSEAALDSECAKGFIVVRMIMSSRRREEVKGQLTIDSNKLENVVDRVNIKFIVTMVSVIVTGSNKCTT